MNRSLKLVALLIVLASFALAIAALAWRWREAGDVAAVFAGPKPFRPMIILALPAVLAGLLAFTDLGLARQEPRITREGRWFVSFTLLTHLVLLVALQAWMVVTYLGPVGPNPVFVTRLLAAFMGLAMVVRANFFAKLRGPDSDLAGDWARTTRRSAILLTLTGLALTVCAATLPMPGLVAAIGGVFVVVMTRAGAQRRASVAR